MKLRAAACPWLSAQQMVSERRIGKTDTAKKQRVSLAEHSLFFVIEHIQIIRRIQ